jgi:hypothetical protein
MTTFAAQPETDRLLAELDARTRSAWSSYRDDLRDLGTDAYDDVEAASWDQLQATLLELESERAALTRPPASA